MKRVCKYAFQKLGSHKHKVLLLTMVAAAGLVGIYSAQWSYKMWYTDNREAVAAAIPAADAFGDHFDKVKYLDQGWNDADSLWFYTTSQGSDLIPYDFFLALEQADKDEPFRSDANMNRYRYLTQKVSYNNPDALPVGMVADTYQGKKYMGFTCAACHTSQINYQGTAIRIDGGQAGADMDTFMKDLGAALDATSKDTAKQEKFVKAVLKLGDYSNKEEVLDDLKTFTTRIGVYNFINHSNTSYGYGRLDAFGRIFNRVLQHVVTEKELRELLKDTLTEQELQQVLPGFKKVLSEQNREHIVEKLANLLTLKQQAELKNKLFNSPNAPVSYPFLWDTPQHDYVQWNGIAANAGEGPIGRNTGEVIGVFGTLDWSEEPGWTLSSALGGQGFGPTHISFKSSVKAHNLRLLEEELTTLESPSWKNAADQHLLPALDEKRLASGEKLFNEYCVACHQEIDRADPDRHVIANFSKLSVAGTDQKMALNAGGTGYAGILTNQYVNMGVGSIYLKDRVPVAALLTKADLNVVATPAPDKWFFQRWADWLHDLIVAYFSNPIKSSSVKVGNYDTSTTANPFASLMAYKARSLNGIWATAPYLHNGSVPTLYDLLLPAHKEPGDPAGMEYRPAKFVTGSREFDPDHVGFKSQGYDGFVFDTGVYGNGNSGHEYGTRAETLPNGKTLAALTREQRLDLLEYLKSL